MADLASSTLEALRVRITQVLPAQVRAAAEKLTEEQMWWRPNEKSNSVTVFAVDRATGKLSGSNESLPIPSPVAVTFYPN